MGVLVGRYRFVRYLGGGGEGHVLLVEDDSGAQFVVKQYAPGWSANDAVLDRLTTARGSLTRQQWASHPTLRNVIWLEEWGTDPAWDVSYEVQEFIPGGTLVQEGALAAWPVDDLATALSAAVSAFHDVAGAHRDIKPANLLARSVIGLVLVLADVGLARVVGDGSKRFSRREGTAAYQAPEAALGEVTRSGDWWSVGMIVAEAVLGSHPMSLDNGTLPADQVISAHLAQRNVPHLDRIADARVRLLCEGLLTRDADLRWDEEQVGQWLAGESPATGFGSPVTISAAGAAGTETAVPRIRSVRFAGNEHDSPEALAAAFAADPGRAGSALFEQKDGPLLEEVRVMLRAAGLHEARTALDSYRSGAWQATFLRLLVEMDADLEPMLAGQPMTPAAIARVAQEVVASGRATSTERRTLAWVTDHDVWQIWRTLPGMDAAGDSADRLAVVEAQVATALASIGAAGATAAGLRVSVPGGQLTWGINGTGAVLVSSAEATQFWAAARSLVSAWSVLCAYDPDTAVGAVGDHLKPLRSRLSNQPWWLSLANHPEAGGDVIALVSVPLAEQSHSALAAHEAERARQAEAAEETHQQEQNRQQAVARVEFHRRVRAVRRDAWRRAFRNLVVLALVGLPVTALAATWAGYARPAVTEWWPGHLVFMEIWLVAVLVQQIILLWGRLIVAGRDLRAQEVASWRRFDRWLRIGVFLAGVAVAALLFSTQAREAGQWYPMPIAAGWFVLAAAAVVAQLVVSVRRVGSHGSVKAWAALVVVALVVGGALTALLSLADTVGVPSPLAASAAGDYEGNNVNGSPVRWDPCTGPIGVSVNYGALVPVYRERARQAVESGIAQISAATGLDFRYRGETDAVPSDRDHADRRDQGDAIRIGFLPPSMSLMAQQGDAQVNAEFSTPSTSSAGGWLPITAGDIQVRSKNKNYTMSVLWGLAYVSGLAIVSESPPTSLMAGNWDLGGYGTADLAGLDAVGAGLGCLK